MKITGSTALVAGATRGIGLAIAEKLAADGARLILPLHDDWLDDLHHVEEKFAGSAAGHICIRVDLRNPDMVRRMIETVGREYGCLHILINNIERGGMPIVHGSYDRQINSEQWRLEMDTTLLAKKLLLENCLPLLKKAKEAAVINISSIAALVGRAGPAGLLYSDGYAAANRAISSLTATWARMGAPTVRVNEIMLGLVDTRHGRGTRGWEALSEEQRERLIAHTLLQRTGRPDEVAGLVLTLLREADYMTGSTLRLDGGYLLGGDDVPVMPDGIVFETES